MKTLQKDLTPQILSSIIVYIEKNYHFQEALI